MSIPGLIASAPLTLDHGGVGYRGVDLATLRAYGVPEAEIVAAVQRWLYARVDAEAEVLRGRVMTPGSGQALEYQEAAAQAAAALAAPAAASAALYPMLAASIGIARDPQTGQPADDVLGVARAVSAASGAWAVIGAEIRAARLAGKAAIAAASTLDAAAAAHGAITWPSVG